MNKTIETLIRICKNLIHFRLTEAGFGINNIISIRPRDIINRDMLSKDKINETIRALEILYSEKCPRDIWLCQIDEIFDFNKEEIKEFFDGNYSFNVRYSRDNMEWYIKELIKVEELRDRLKKGKTK